MRRAASVGLVLAGLGVLYWFFWIRPGDVDDSTALGVFVEAEMINIPRAGDDFAFDDDDLIRDMTGSLRPEGALVDAASCVVGSDWLRDRVLDNQMVVATDPALVRAAELYDEAIVAGELDRARLIAATEQRYWALDADTDRLEQWAESLNDEVGAATVTYLTERAEPPSEDAQRRFIVYVVQGNGRVQRIFYLDGARLRPNRLASPSGRASVSDQLIAGADETGSLPLRDCDEVARGWDLYDPDLPEMPPIEDRWQFETGQSGQNA